MLPLGFVSAFAGFAALCLAMERHHGDALGTRRIPARRALVLRVAGWLLLALSLPLCASGWGWGMGVVAWCGTLSAAALPLVLLLSYAPRLITWLALALPPLAGLSLALRTP
ncbi:DUF3325 domain-containing protein [Sabulicella rubraurantiaca]|uniref:DUF3325 domain-containing protein n=1 Tax=Sabulicella rubraurantiaca TaxID=2811429 RepID=UPI001A9750E8|nr:DUF3325 domain-containing protein [Sabulicella rubraurantiaca]